MDNQKLINKKINFNEIFFIAGGSGMAGKAITAQLKKAGYGNKQLGGSILTPSRLELDLFNYEDVKSWFKRNKPTVVILAAAKVGGILANSSQPYDFISQNLRIQTNVINNAFNFKVKRLLFLGSSCIYPKFAKQPISEEELLNGSLESTNEFYALAKIAGIKLCESLRIQYNFDAISLMPTNLYGPGDNYDSRNSHVMASLLKKFYNAKLKNETSVECWGSGKPMREFMHIDDLGNAAVFALENWDPSSSSAPLNKNGTPLTYLNVGTGKDISIKDLSIKISNLIDFKGRILWDKDKPDGTFRKQLDISRIQKLGWEPKISLDTGILRTLEEFKNREID